MTKKRVRKSKPDKIIGLGSTPEERMLEYIEGRFQERQYMEKYKWVWHGVFDEHSRFVDAHTHGLAEHFGHMDLQITLPLSPSRIQEVFNGLVAQIAAGMRFVEGELYDDLLCAPFKVKFIRAIECGREVLRMIVSDEAGNLDREVMDPSFAQQYDLPLSGVEATSSTLSEDEKSFLSLLG